MYLVYSMYSQNWQMNYDIKNIDSSALNLKK